MLQISFYVNHINSYCNVNNPFQKVHFLRQIIRKRMQKTKERLIKITHQYNKKPIAQEDMDKLLEIAKDYRQVKNHVYSRYGGINGLSKLYPGYTIQNEMTKSGIREQLGLPSVYFYLAIFDALGDIKTLWSKTKNEISKNITRHESFTDDEKHYLRLILKSGNCLDDVLHYRKPKPDKAVMADYQRLTEQTDTHRLQQYLRRQVRKHLKTMHTDKADIFSIGERAYRYGDDGIYISIKEKRKRIYVPLTDNQQYKRQLQVVLYPEKCGLELLVPIDVRTKCHPDYTEHIAVTLGVHTMLVTHQGHSYGEMLGQYLSEKAEWICEHNSNYQRQRKADKNPIGRKKYQEQKRRIDAKLHTYINQDLNRFISEEKPETIYIPKLPQHAYGGNYQSSNYITTIWEHGYIRKRLSLKCREHNIKLVEVFAKDIGRQCSQCGAIGEKKKGIFCCKACGYQIDEKINTAQNVYNRGNLK